MILTLIAVCIVLQFSVSSADPCAFTAPSVIAITRARECFDSIPLSPTIKAKTIQQIRLVADLYSFTDIAVSPPPPYHVHVDFYAELTRMERTVYRSDFAFHEDMKQLFRSFGDSHLEYTGPLPYTSFLLPWPFRLSGGTGPTTDYTVIAETTVFGRKFSEFLPVGMDLQQYVGRRIVAIDGLPVHVWMLDTLAFQLGTSHDPGVRLNIALSMLATNPYFMVAYDYPFPTTDSLLIQFDGDSVPVTVPILLATSRNFSSSAEFVSSTLRESSSSMSMGMDGIRRQRLQYLRSLRHDGLSTTRVRRSHASTFDVPSAAASSDNAIEILHASITGDVVCGVSALYPSSLYLYLATFAPLHPDLPGEHTAREIVADFLNTVQKCRATATSLSLESLVLDVRFNSGGFICLSVLSASLLFEDSWGRMPSAKAIKNTMEVYDLRKSVLTDELAAHGILRRFRVNPAGMQMSTDVSEWYGPSITVSRGGRTSRYTTKGYYPPQCAFPASPDFWSSQYEIFNQSKPWRFSRVMVLTDGQCGSACSQMISHLRYRGVAAIIAKGGLVFENVETSSYAGGNYLFWDDMVADIQKVPSLQQSTGADHLPTNAFVSFNFNEMYLGDSVYPREYTKMEADVQLKSWNFEEDMAVYVPTARNDAIQAGKLQLTLAITMAFQQLANDTLFASIKPLGPTFPDLSFSQQADIVSQSDSSGDSQNNQKMRVGAMFWIVVSVIFVVLVAGSFLLLFRQQKRQGGTGSRRWNLLNTDPSEQDNT